jgi:hypothetical protein
MSCVGNWVPPPPLLQTKQRRAYPETDNARKLIFGRYLFEESTLRETALTRGFDLSILVDGDIKKNYVMKYHH